MQNPADWTPFERDEALVLPDPSVWAKMSSEEITESISRALEEIDQSDDLRWLDESTRATFRRLEKDEIEGGWPAWQPKP